VPPLALSLSHSLFASGFSNGGFVTSLLPTRSRLRWRGIAPAAGHDYDAIADRPIPISMHHCEKDTAVRLNGCCDGASSCCCHIGVGRAECTGSRAIHARWLRVNRCAGSRMLPGPAGAMCEVGVGCAANTSLCIYPPSTGCFHSQWSDDFSAWAVVGFFAREVCSRQPAAAVSSSFGHGAGGASFGRAVAAVSFDHNSAPVGHSRPEGGHNGVLSHDRSIAWAAACAFASMADGRLAREDYTSASSHSKNWTQRWHQAAGRRSR
jgi:hypothetical protein